MCELLPDRNSLSSSKVGSAIGYVSIGLVEKDNRANGGVFDHVGMEICVQALSWTKMGSRTEHCIRTPSNQLDAINHPACPAERRRRPEGMRRCPLTR